MSGADNLFDACSELLAAAAQAVAGAPGGVIGRAFVSAGVPAWDCPDQLTVHAGAAQLGDTAPLSPPLQPGHRLADGRQLDLATLTITVLRCVPTMDQEGQTLVLPEPAALEEAARVTMGDLWAIWNHVATLKRADLLFPPKVREVFFDPAVPVQTLGGVGGWQIPVRVQVDGYRTSAAPTPSLVWSYNGGQP